jgi:16S rRNA (uracil1498-N3)-methyltransferase
MLLALQKPLYDICVRLHRFIIDVDLSRSSLTISDGGVLHQWQKVLRLKAQDTVILCDGKEMECEATLESIEAKHAQLKLEQAHPVTAEPTRHVTLYCSVLKRENFEWVVQKCTELGVKKIVPIIAERTVKTGLKMERLGMIAKEAAEQSGRGMIPVIAEPINFALALMQAKKNALNMFFHYSKISQPRNLRNPATFANFNIWIGPEGGWTEEDVRQAQEYGFQMCSLGMLVLRAETAAIAATFLAEHP